MLFILFVSLAILGAILLLTLTLFSNRDRAYPELSTYEQEYAIVEEPELSGQSGALPAEGPKEEKEQEVSREEADLQKGASGPSLAADSAEKDYSVAYIPVLPREGPIPGVRAAELLHYRGRGAYYSIDDGRDPGEMEIDISALSPAVEGDIALTTKHVVVFSENIAKTIATYMIEKYHFHGDVLVLKRKTAKLKKDVVRIDGDSERFRTTLQTLMSHG